MNSTRQTDDDVPAIERHSVASQVYSSLRSRILSGKFPQGERVVEAAIAKSLGVSRAPVREAVNRLTEAGLLENRTHFGPSVVHMDMDKIRQLYAVRNAIEALAIRAVALKHTAADIRKLREFIDVMTVHARAGDLRGLSDAELDFHEALWQMAGNQYVEKVASLLFDHLRLALTIDNAGYDSLVDVAREHEALIDAIEAGDPDRASEVLTIHIMASLEGRSSK